MSGAPNIFSFEDYALDVDRQELRRGDDLLAVEPQVLDILQYLIRHRERVVSKDDLIAHIWKGRIISESALTSRMTTARQVIGDSGGQQRLIRTIARKGFRFVGDVRVLRRSREEVGNTPDSGPAIAAGPALSGSPERPSIAVLPFADMSDVPQQAYLADGITEDIITELSRFSELLVIARNSSFKYKGQSVDVRQAGHELGVRYILEGSIRRSGDRIRISAQLVEAATGGHRWAERYDRKIEDVFALQDELARTIAAVLAVHVNRGEIERALAKPPATWQAYDYYMQAADILGRSESSQDKDHVLSARRLLRQALVVDPGYARAHAALSRTYVSLWSHHWDDDDCSWTVALDGAYQSAHEAVRLAPNLAQARAALGFALVWRRQHEAAIAEFERAFALNPNLTNFQFAFALLLGGEPERAIASVNAHMRLDPFYGPYAPAILGLACYMLKRYADALPHLQECVARAPNMWAGHAWLAAVYAQLGQPEKARAEAAEVRRIEPTHVINWTPLPFKRGEDLEHYVNGLRRAGVPE